MKEKIIKNNLIFFIWSKYLKDFLYNNRSILIILFISSVLSLVSIFDNSSHSLIAHDEGLYARRARVIVDSGEWFTPFSEPHHKTIGSYWLIALSMKFFGFNETTARLPSAIFSILCSLTLYKIVQELINERAGLLAGLILPTMPIWFQYSHYASPDIAFIFFILLAVYLITKSNSNFDINSTNHRLLWTYAGLSFSIAFFLRSFMLLLPLVGLIPFIFLSLRTQNKSSFYYFLIGIFIGLIPTFLNLYFSYSLYGPNVFHSLTNFAHNQAFNSDEYAYSFIEQITNYSFYPLTILLFSFPGGIIGIFSFGIIFNNKDILTKSLLLVFPIIILICLVLISTRLSHYSLIIYPWLAIFSGISIDAIISNELNFSNSFRIFISLIFLGIGLALICSLFLGILGIIELNQLNHTITSYSIIFLAISYCISAYLLVLPVKHNIYLKFSFAIVFFMQSLFLTLLFGQGILWNPNKDLKYFLLNPIVQDIVFNTKIYLVDVNKPSKERTLLEFYLPKWQHFKGSLDELSLNSHLLISKEAFANAISNSSIQYNEITTFRNYILIELLNI